MKAPAAQAARTARAAFWLVTASVLLLALIPTEQVRHLPLNSWDKGQHALAFGALTAMGLWAWPAHGQRLRLVVGLLALGGCIEVAQHVTGWRHGEWADWAADAVGVGVIALGRRLLA